MNKEEKIKEAHNLLVKGLNNGLSITFKDKKTEDKNFWEKRSYLFDVFSHYVMDVIWENERSDEIHFEELKKIAEEGYKLKEKNKMSNEIEILKVYAQKDEDGFVGFDWEGKGGVNIWFMIGVLESIKQDLLREGEKLSEEKQW